MKSFFLLAVATATPVAAQDGSIDRPGTMGMAGGVGSTRAGQPVTLPAPVRTDPTGAALGRFAATYRRAGSPRMMMFWNRSFTSAVTSGQESWSRTTTDVQADGESHRVAYGTRNADHLATDGSARASATSETRSGVEQMDPGGRDTPNDEVTDFDVQRGFSEAFEQAGARLVDRTAALRTVALGGGTDNAQALEMRAVLDRTDLMLEIVPLKAAGDVTYKITVRDARSARIVATLRSTGLHTTGRMPYVAGEHGFVRANPPRASAYDVGRQVALDTMTALASRL